MVISRLMKNENKCVNISSFLTTTRMGSRHSVRLQLQRLKQQNAVIELQSRVIIQSIDESTIVVKVSY